jgi:hypothetical protein
VVVRETEETDIKVPQRFSPGDEVSIKQGKALIMLFSGEEVPLSAVSYYTIPNEEKPSDSDIAKLANSKRAEESLLAQSGVAYRLRGQSNVFPRKSHLLDPEKAILHIAFENPSDLDLKLEIHDSFSQKVVFEKEHISDSIISLAEVPFKEGKSYYWTISNTPDGRPELGSIVVPSSESTSLTDLNPKPETHFEYINTISAYYNATYNFEALALIREAMEKFPEVEIYEVMLGNILGE